MFAVGWGGRHRLALAEGCLGFFLLTAPLFEFVIHPGGKPMSGMTLVAVATLAALVWLDRVTGRRTA